tara:strand:- start:99 stop:566 length:468 start_codon:yes stop_codon:yes gene_type:complete
MSIKDTAKELIKKGIEIGDNELITMANELLKSVTDSEDILDIETVGLEVEKEPEKEIDIRPEPDSFISAIRREDDSNHQRIAKTQKIDLDGDRHNKFTDDLSEHTSVTTPDMPPTARHRRPFKKVEAVCRKCNKTVETHPAHKREWFVCDGCIKR